MNKMILISGLALSFALTAGVEPQHRAPATRASQIQTAAQPMPEARVLGLLDERMNDVVIAPSTVSAGEEFQVTITTIGGGCERAGDTGVVVTENNATVMVYDLTTATRPGVACTMILKHLPHKAMLRFTKPGEAVIRIWGRRAGAGTPPMGEPTVIERRVVVK